jgi:hypothetical protein
MIAALLAFHAGAAVATLALLRPRFARGFDEKAGRAVSAKTPKEKEGARPTQLTLSLLNKHQNRPY